MGSDSVDPAVIHDNDPVAVFYAGNTLCDDQFGRAGNFLPESLSDLCVCCSVHSAGAVIQNQYFGLFEQCPRDTEPLSLSAGYISASLFDPGIVALRHFSDKFICAGHFTYSHALFFRGVFVSPPQIVKYRAAEQDVFLKDDRNLISQRFNIVAADIVSSHKDSALCHIIETADQIDQ